MLDTFAILQAANPLLIDGVRVLAMRQAGYCAGLWRCVMDGDLPDVIVRECDYAAVCWLGTAQARVLILIGQRTRV